MTLIQKEPGGVIVYALDEEGRGIGLENKIKSMEIQRKRGFDTVRSFAELGFMPDERDFERSTAVLHDLNVSKTIRLISESPQKRNALIKAGYTIASLIPIPLTTLTEIGQQERDTKERKLGYSSESAQQTNDFTAGLL